MSQIRYNLPLEADFLQEDAALGTDFRSDQVTLHNKHSFGKIDLTGGSGGSQKKTPYLLPSGILVTPSADTYNASYPIHQLFNGTITARETQTSTYYLSDSTGNQTLTFDFGSGQPVNIRKICVYPRSRDDASSNYRILTSADGTTFTPVVDWVVNTHDALTPYDTVREHPVEITSRYIRFELTRNGSYGITLSEIEFYEADLYEPAPLRSLHLKRGTFTHAASLTGDDVRMSLVDDFLADTLDHYITGGDSAATWTIDPLAGTLTAVGGSQATFLKKDSGHKETAIEVITDSADNGGLIARWQNNANYYLLNFSDDVTNPGSNLNLYRRIGGTYTLLGSANVTWPRGRKVSIRLHVYGTRLLAFFNNRIVIDEKDGSIPNAGLCGMRNHGIAGIVGPTTIYRSFRIHSLTPSTTLPGTRIGSQPLGLEGTASDQTRITWSPADSGVRMNGDYIEIPYEAGLDITGALTLEAKVQIHGTGEQGILEKYAWAAGVGGYGLRITSDNKLSGFVIAGANTTTATSTRTLLPGVTYRLAMTYDPTAKVVIVYINGIPEGIAGDVVTPALLASPNVPLKLGAIGDNARNPFTGLLYEARVWNICRTPEEIRAYLQQDLPALPPGLIGHWQLNEGSGTVARDSSSNARDGILRSGVSFFTNTSTFETRLSLDGGKTFLHDWQTPLNGGTIPGLAGKDHSRVTLFTRQTLTSDHPEIPAEFERVRLEIPHSFGAHSIVCTGNSQILHDDWHHGIANVRTVATEPEGTFLRFLVSYDQRQTWHAFDGAQWQQVDLLNIHRLGMSRSVLEALSPAQWQELFAAFIPDPLFTVRPLDFAVGLRTTDSLITPGLNFLTVSARLEGITSVHPSGAGTVIPAQQGFRYPVVLDGESTTPDGLIATIWSGSHGMLPGGGRTAPSLGWLHPAHVIGTGDEADGSARRLPGGINVKHAAGPRSGSAIQGYAFHVHLTGAPVHWIWRGVEYGVGTDRVRLRARKLPIEWHPLANYSGEGSYDKSISPYDQIAPNWEKYKNWE